MSLWRCVNGYQCELDPGRSRRRPVWAVNTSVSGVNIHTIGVILLVVGVIGFVTSLFFWSSWGGFGNRSTTVVRDTSLER